MIQRQIMQSGAPIPDWWRSDFQEIESDLIRLVQRGKLDTIAISPGKRPVRVVTYGEPEPELMGTANFNSAMGSDNPQSYVRRSERKRPVLLIIAGMHGQEPEGVMGVMSIIHLLETGRDLMGRKQPELLDKLSRLRLVLVPMANPDGRARVPYKGWVGLPEDEMTWWGQGARMNGEPYQWAGCKAYHPMKEDVGFLGGYFDDNGVNIQHDNWARPMSAATQALLETIANEGPDCFINLHSYGQPPIIFQTGYTTLAHMKRVYAFAHDYYARLDKKGLTHKPLGPKPTLDHLASDRIPSFSFQSLAYHLGADFNISYESPHGCLNISEEYDYPDILEVHHILFHAAADELLDALRQG